MPEPAGGVFRADLAREAVDVMKLREHFVSAPVTHLCGDAPDCAQCAENLAARRERRRARNLFVPLPATEAQLDRLEAKLDLLMRALESGAVGRWRDLGPRP